MPIEERINCGTTWYGTKQELKVDISDQGEINVQEVSQNVFQRFINFFKGKNSALLLTSIKLETFKPTHEDYKRHCKDVEPRYFKSLGNKNKNITELKTTILSHLKKLKDGDEKIQEVYQKVHAPTIVPKGSIAATVNDSGEKTSAILVPATAPSSTKQTESAPSAKLKETEAAFTKVVTEEMSRADKIDGHLREVSKRCEALSHIGIPGNFNSQLELVIEDMEERWDQLKEAPVSAKTEASDEAERAADEVLLQTLEKQVQKVVKSYLEEARGSLPSDVLASSLQTASDDLMKAYKAMPLEHVPSEELEEWTPEQWQRKKTELDKADKSSWTEPQKADWKQFVVALNLVSRLSELGRQSIQQKNPFHLITEEFLNQLKGPRHFAVKILISQLSKESGVVWNGSDPIGKFLSEVSKIKESLSSEKKLTIDQLDLRLRPLLQSNVSEMSCEAVYKRALEKASKEAIALDNVSIADIVGALESRHKIAQNLSKISSGLIENFPKLIQFHQFFGDALSRIPPIAINNPEMANLLYKLATPEEVSFDTTERPKKFTELGSDERGKALQKAFQKILQPSGDVIDLDGINAHLADLEALQKEMTLLKDLYENGKEIRTQIEVAKKIFPKPAKELEALEKRVADSLTTFAIPGTFRTTHKPLSQLRTELDSEVLPYFRSASKQLGAEQTQLNKLMAEYLGSMDDPVRKQIELDSFKNILINQISVQSKWLFFHFRDYQARAFETMGGAPSQEKLYDYLKKLNDIGGVLKATLDRLKKPLEKDADPSEIEEAINDAVENLKYNTEFVDRDPTDPALDVQRAKTHVRGVGGTVALLGATLLATYAFYRQGLPAAAPGVPVPASETGGSPIMQTEGILANHTASRVLIEPLLPDMRSSLFNMSPSLTVKPLTWHTFDLFLKPLDFSYGEQGEGLSNQSHPNVTALEQ